MTHLRRKFILAEAAARRASGSDGAHSLVVGTVEMRGSYSLYKRPWLAEIFGCSCGWEGLTKSFVSEREAHEYMAYEHAVHIRQTILAEDGFEVEGLERWS